MKAYITLLSTPEYLDGVLILHQSLIETGAKYPLYVGITPNIPPDVREVLVKKKISIIELTSFSYNQKAKKPFLHGAFHIGGIPQQKLGFLD